MSAIDPTQVLHVVCLCAAWCRTCQAYGDTLHGVMAKFVPRGHALPARWVDIEDEADPALQALMQRLR